MGDTLLLLAKQPEGYHSLLAHCIGHGTTPTLAFCELLQLSQNYGQVSNYIRTKSWIRLEFTTEFLIKWYC